MKRVTRADPDEDILAFIADGEMEGALRSLMRKHGTSVYRYGLAVLRDPALALEIQGQVFIEAHRDLKSFSGHCSVRTWLFTITRHRVLDAHRRAQRHIVDRDASDIPELRPDGAWPQPTLLEILYRLPTGMLDAVLLRFQQGFTFEDIARICHERPGTLEARITRAISRLRHCVEHVIEDALAWLGAEHEPPPGWETGVVAAIDAMRRRRRLLLPYAISGAAVAAAA